MKRKENRGTVLSYSLPRRLLVLFLIFALTLYAVGMAVTYQLKEKARQDLQSEYRDRIAQLSAQFSGEIERIPRPGGVYPHPLLRAADGAGDGLGAVFRVLRRGAANL